MSPGDEPTTVGGLEPKVDTDSKHRLTIGAEEDASGCFGQRRSVADTGHHSLRTVDTVRNSYVGSSPLSVKTECVDVVTDKLLVVSAGASQLQHVLSGGYCCEMDSKPSSFAGDDFYAVDAKPATVTSLSDDTAMANTSVAASQTTMDVKQATPDVSPGSKWHIAGDRDSPYVSVMALASSYHLFSESCPSSSTAVDDDSLVYDQASSRYWLEPELPDENVIFTEKHCEMINQITAAYDRYVQTGTIINETLVTEMKVSLDDSLKQLLPVDAPCCHMGTSIKHPVPDRLKHCSHL